MMLRRGWLRIALAVLLLAAQHGALTHGVVHVVGEPVSQSQPRDFGDKRTQSGLCDFHVSFVHILGATNCAETALPIAINSTERSANSFPYLVPATPVLAAARGPPTLL